MEEDSPWLLIGDLNEVLDSSEKFGGRSIVGKQLFLKDFLFCVAGVDIGFYGRKYTWENKHEGLSLIKEHIDRAVADHAWLQLFPNAKVTLLTLEDSDHVPLLLHVMKVGKEGRRPFKFLKVWTLDPDSKQVVKNA